MSKIALNFHSFKNLSTVRNPLLLSLFFILLSCESSKNEKTEDYQYYYLNRQVTPSGKYIIYNYSRSGAMAFSSDIVGTELFHRDSIFKERKGIAIDGQIKEWISNDTLLVLISKPMQAQDTFPTEIEIEKNRRFYIEKNLF